MKFLKSIFILILAVFAGLTQLRAQNSNKDKKAAHIAEIKDIVEAQNYVFKANYVIPTRGVSRSLTSDYDLVVTKDTVTAFLPYFGRAYNAVPYNPTDGGIKFTNTNFTYTSSAGKKGGWTVTIKPNKTNISDWRDVQNMRLSISPDGYGSLQVISSNRDPISFNGTIEKREIKK